MGYHVVELRLLAVYGGEVELSLSCGKPESGSEGRKVRLLGQPYGYRMVQYCCASQELGVMVKSAVERSRTLLGSRKAVTTVGASRGAWRRVVSS